MNEFDESSIRKDLVKACRFLYAAKIVGDGTSGHLSARLDEGRILIKPRPASWRFLRPEDLVVLDFAGKQPDSGASASDLVREWPIHTQIYNHRQDCRWVLHAHPASSTIMAALGISVEPIDQDCILFTGQLPVLENGGVSINTPALGDLVSDALALNNALLIKNHGSIVVGTDASSVCLTAYKLERVAETMLRVASVSNLPAMTGDDQKRFLEARRDGRPSPNGSSEKFDLLCDYYLRCAEEL